LKKNASHRKEGSCNNTSTRKKEPANQVQDSVGRQKDSSLITNARSLRKKCAESREEHRHKRGVHFTLPGSMAAEGGGGAGDAISTITEKKKTGAWRIHPAA